MSVSCNRVSNSLKWKKNNYEICHHVSTHSEYGSNGVFAAQDECTPVPEGQSVRQVDHQEGEAHGDVRRERLLYSHGHSILQVLIISVVQACRLARWEAKLELNRNQIANSRAFWHQQMSHLIQFLCFYGFYPLIQPFRGFFLWLWSIFICPAQNVFTLLMRKQSHLVS